MSMGRETLQSVERTFQVMELLAERGAMGVRELSQETDFHTTVVHRILGTLTELGYASQERDGKYYLTYKTLAMGNQIQMRNDVAQLVQPFLKELSEQCRETAHFVEREGTNIRYLGKVTPTANMFATGSYVGMELPLAGTAAGKAILAKLPLAEVEDIWDKSQIVRYTPNTICTKERLLEEMKEIRNTGFAYDREEREMGLICVGTAILDYQGISRYAISISGPVARMQGERLDEIRKNMEDARCKIEGIVGKRS